MKGSECRLIEYMEGSKKRFIIPVYQRNYDWKTENCKQLYDDLVKVIKNNRKSHFFGSLVSVYQPSGRNTEFLVIDGQQRLTTVSLLFLAMYNLIKNEVLEPEDPSISEEIFDNFLVDKYKKGETRIKLKPVKNDQKAFGKLFESEEDYIRGSNLTTNYNYFYDRIQKQEITLDELYDAICMLEVINITLSGEDNPQLIFESLNSTGLDLSEGDKIRNYILMGLPVKMQDEYYDKYWNRIEECTKYDVSAFVRDYLSVKQFAIPSQKRIYTSFKNYVENNKIETKDLLEDLLGYAKRYSVLLNGNTKNRHLNACIYRLNRLETTVTRPFFLEVLRLFNEDKLDISQVTDIFSITENFIFRRSICDIPTNALNKIFLSLHREIIRYDGTEDNYVEKLKYAILSKKESGRFPDDDEFKNVFSEKQVYQLNRKNKLYILERFENYGTNEDKDIYGRCDEGDYSIEHIMPQVLNKKWMDELGDDYEQIHSTWLHRIANLTITAYNSKYSNSSFKDKKTMKNGYVESGIRLNTYFIDKDKWTLSELEERNEYLMGRALEIWPTPITNFKPKEKQLDSLTLDDDTDVVSGRHIMKFRYKNIEQPVQSWVEMLVEVLKILYNSDEGIITRLATSNDDNLSIFFGLSKTEVRGEEIADGIFVHTHSNTKSKLSILSKVFKLYDEDPNDLVFYLRNENDQDKDKEDIKTRYAIRLEYWGQALPVIKKENGGNSFSNVNPSKDNWINGFFGISDFSITCIARFDAAIVKLHLGKKATEKNKKAFDVLFENKDKIEKELGVTLEWKRNDDHRSSNIVYRLEGVNIANKTDWIQMANFHAKWSKKFYDVFVPYLRDLY
ncbi:MAG: DUF4268 domain-containing protein [Lachnospiraceae bacterium]|nr:DUF4268 domain-containing protein [Lachnospiraceae bacterium]